MKIRELIRSEPIWVSPYLSIADVARVMDECGCAFLPILEDGRAVGVVTDRDVAMASASKGLNAKATRIREVMSANPHSVSADAFAEDAAREMIAHNVRRLVVHEDGRFIGVVSMVDLAGLIGDERIAHALREMAAKNFPHHVHHETHPVPGQYLG